MTDPEAFWCDICNKIDDTPHTPIDHPWTLRGYAHGKRCRETKEKYQTLLKAAQDIMDAYDNEAFGRWIGWPNSTLFANLRAAIGGETK